MIARFASCTQGGIAAMTALLVTVLIGISGLGVELGYWYAVRGSMQGAADAGAIEAALSYKAGNTGGYTSAAKAVTAQNGWTDGAGGAGQTISVSVNTPAANGNYTSSSYQNKAFEVVITRPQRSMFAWAVGYSSSPTIAVHSTALLTNTGNGCVLALNNSASAISISGNGNLTASNCGVDSNGNVAFGGGSNPQLTASSLTVGLSSANCPPVNCHVSGSVTGNTSVSDPYSGRAFSTPPDTRVTSLTRSGTTVTGTTAIPDGFAALKSVTVVGATGTNYNGTFTVATVPNSSTFTYSIVPPLPTSPDPGTTITACETVGSAASYAAAIYCGTTVAGGSFGFASDTVFNGAVTVTSTVTFGGSAGGSCPVSPSVVYFEGGLSVSGGASVKFCPGIYYVEGGSLSVSGNSNANVTGSGVTFILTTLPWGTAAYATANIAGQGTVTLSAPTGSTTITLPGGTTATVQTAGLVFFQDRNAPISSTVGISVGGQGTISLTGVIYSPTETVTLAGNGVSGNANTCTQVVAQYVVATGNGTFSNACTGDGTSNFGTGGTTTVSMAE